MNTYLVWISFQEKRLIIDVFPETCRKQSAALVIESSQQNSYFNGSFDICKTELDDLSDWNSYYRKHLFHVTINIQTDEQCEHIRQTFNQTICRRWDKTRE